MGADTSAVTAGPEIASADGTMSHVNTAVRQASKAGANTGRIMTMTTDLREKLADICDAEIQSDNPSCYMLADALIAALPELQGWQPIETAPKDGATILATRNEMGFRVPTIIFWDEEFGWCGLTAENEKRLVKHAPTHWAAIPAFGIAAAGGEGE